MGASLTLLAVCRHYSWFDRSILDGRAEAWKQRWRSEGDMLGVASQDDTPWWSDLAVFILGLLLCLWSLRISAVSETVHRAQYTVPPEVIGNPLEDDPSHDGYYDQKVKPSWSSNQSMIALWLLVVIPVSQSLTLPCLVRFLPVGLTMHFLYLLVCCWIWFRSYSGCCGGVVPVLCAIIAWLAFSVVPCLPSPRSLCVALLAAGSVAMIALGQLEALSVCCSGPLPADYTQPALTVSALMVLGLAAATFYAYNQILPLQNALMGKEGLLVQIEVCFTVSVNAVVVLAYLIAILRSPTWSPPPTGPSKTVNIEMGALEDPGTDWDSGSDSAAAAATGVGSNKGRSMIGSRDIEDGPSEDGVLDREWPAEGETVQLCGLTSFPWMNGEHGTVVGYDMQHNRYAIKLQDGAIKSVRLFNLRRPKSIGARNGNEGASPNDDEAEEDFSWMQNYGSQTPPPPPPSINYAAANSRRPSFANSSTPSTVSRLGEFVRDEMSALADLAGDIRNRGITGVMKDAVAEAKDIVSNQAGGATGAEESMEQSLEVVTTGYTDIFVIFNTVTNGAEVCREQRHCHNYWAIVIIATGM
ncbi:Transcription elongation factor SPT4 [Perkinsus chesapeaki]|uniref:Transcription elongation factor SPT4 n=1 Tax=Perkinsus chesapeaki TaxID=330153 RepID=A0A7J6N4M9_PERCH|nr:Transcription elongation factor SPT4 [Perkinsus chesapeaki]